MARQKQIACKPIGYHPVKPGKEYSSEPLMKRRRLEENEEDKKYEEYGQQPKVDLWTGQRAFFPGLDDPPEDGVLNCDDECEDALAYLRSVRSQANGIPALLTARPNGTSIRPPITPTQELEEGEVAVTAVEQDEEGFYEDGAYSIARPDPAQSASPFQLIQRSFHASVAERFQRHVADLNRGPKAWQDGGERYSEGWYMIKEEGLSGRNIPWLKTWWPQLDVLTRLDKNSVLRILEFVRTRRLVTGTSLTKPLAALIWSLLARLMPLHRLWSEEVNSLRELGKVAAKALEKMKGVQSGDVIGEEGARVEDTPPIKWSWQALEERDAEWDTSHERRMKGEQLSVPKLPLEEDISDLSDDLAEWVRRRQKKKAAEARVPEVKIQDEAVEATATEFEQTNSGAIPPEIESARDRVLRLLGEDGDEEEIPDTKEPDRSADSPHPDDQPAGSDDRTEAIKAEEPEEPVDALRASGLPATETLYNPIISNTPSRERKRKYRCPSSSIDSAEHREELQAWCGTEHYEAMLVPTAILPKLKALLSQGEEEEKEAAIEAERFSSMSDGKTLKGKDTVTANKQNRVVAKVESLEDVRGTLEMIVVVVAEEFGQRDLLELIPPWDVV